MTERERLIEIIGKSLQRNIDKSCKLTENIVDDIIGAGVIMPPVKVGDIVYTNHSMSGWYMRLQDRPYEARVVYLGINGKSDFMNVAFVKNDNMLAFDFSDIGKTVFLTREEAEKALAERSEI